MDPAKFLGEPNPEGSLRGATVPSYVGCLFVPICGDADGIFFKLLSVKRLEETLVHDPLRLSLIVQAGFQMDVGSAET